MVVLFERIEPHILPPEYTKTAHRKRTLLSQKLLTVSTPSYQRHVELPRASFRAIAFMQEIAILRWR